MSSPGLSNLKNVSVQDKKMIEDIEAMMGPEPSEMGFIKNMFWGRFRSDLVFPYPEQRPEQQERCEKLLAELEDYLKNEHPAIKIDQEEQIPDWCIDRLFELGVMGMIIPEEYGGLDLGVTSYNRVLELIGSYCGSTAVVVSAHQSIGCKAIVMFGTEEQKEKWLPVVARERLSAFCLSEPNVGSDAAGQETYCEWNEEEQCYILNGEKKWSTSGSMSALFTVMAKQKLTDSRTGKEVEKVTALICTPDMEGVEVFEKNRSKTGIRGTWQARIRFNNVRVPKENLLHKEGRGLHVALTCLNYGRCTLSAGITGAAKVSMDQGVKWAMTRYQFGRPLGDFELVKQKIARMSALCYVMDAVLYMVTGMLDRHDADIMVETAATKVICSKFGWEVIDDVMQIMGGEGYMTEHELERSWRDSRIHSIVEGSNDVMQSFIFAYGGKQLAEQMMSVQEALLWDENRSTGENLQRLLVNSLNPTVMKRAVPLGLQLFFHLKPGRPEIHGVHPTLGKYADRLAGLVREHSHYFKLASKWNEEKIVQRQAVQARVADNAIYLFALSASLSKMDSQLRRHEEGPAFERDKRAFEHLFDLFELEIRGNVRELKENADESMREAARASMNFTETLPNEEFYIHEASPVAEGKDVPRENIPQFPGDGFESQGDGRASDGTAEVKPSHTNEPREATTAEGGKKGEE